MPLTLTYIGQHKEIKRREEENCLETRHTSKAGLSERFEVDGRVVKVHTTGLD